MIKNAIFSAAARALIATAVIGGGLMANTAVAQPLTAEVKAKAKADLKVALASATTKAQVVAALNAAAAAGLTKGDVLSTMKTVQAEAVANNNTVLLAVIAPIVTAVETASNSTSETVVTFTTTPTETTTTTTNSATADIGQPGSTTGSSSMGGNSTVSVYVG